MVFQSDLEFSMLFLPDLVFIPVYKKVLTPEILFGIIMETICVICFQQSISPFGIKPDDQREENIL